LRLAQNARDELVRIRVRARLDPLEDDGADSHSAIRDLSPERQQARAADVVFAVDVPDQQARVRAGDQPRDAEFVGTRQPGEQRPVLGLGGRRAGDGLGVPGEPDPAVVVEDVADCGASWGAKRAPVGVKDGETRSRPPLGARRLGVRLGEGPPLGVRGRAPFAAGSATARGVVGLTGQTVDSRG
jgi:hypothetical protein